MGIMRRGLIAVTIVLGMGGSGWLAGEISGTALALGGRTYYVATTGSDATTCQANSNLHPFQTITRALACVAADQPTILGADSVHIAAGTYPETLTIPGNVKLLGAGRGTTTIDGGYSGSSVISNCCYTVGISGVTITHGGSFSPGFFGGGIANGGNMTVDNSLVTNNDADCGAGVYNGRTMALVNTPVTGNGADDGAGGGIFNGAAATMTLNNSPVTGNYADSGGGGIANGSNAADCPSVGGTMRLTNSPVSNNTGYDGDGGGILNYDHATLTLLNSPVGGSQSPFIYNPFAGANTGNYAEGNGGGIWNDESTATLLNSPVSWNGTRCGDGAGIWNGDGGTMGVQNSLVSNNQIFYDCSNNGGGIWNDSTTNSRLTLENENIIHNFAPQDGGGLYDNGSEPDTEGPSDSCTGLLDVTMSNTVITQNQIDNC